MQKIRLRLVAVPLAGAAMVAGSAWISATSASAHDHPAPVANVGDSVEYATHQVQLHLDAPRLGLDPAVADPYGYATGHVFGTSVNIVSYALTGHPAADDHTGDGHDH